MAISKQVELKLRIDTVAGGECATSAFAKIKILPALTIDWSESNK